MRRRHRYPAIDLRGAVVLVTGATGGIGRALGEAFAARSSRVCLTGRDRDATGELARALGAHAFTLDVTSNDSVAGCLEAVRRRCGRIDVLVNNAGIMPVGRFLDEPDSTTAAVLETNLAGPLRVSRLALPRMVDQGRGHIVNIASVAGAVPLPGLATYTASKHGLVGFSAALRHELRHTGVSVTVVLPGPVRTALSAGVPTGRGWPLLEPHHVARAVVAGVRTRPARVVLPRWLALLAALDAALPEPVTRCGHRVLRSDRALTHPDHTARAAYEHHIAVRAAQSPAQAAP